MYRGGACGDFSALNRRDFLERFFYALTCAMLALFGIRPDLEHEEVKALARKVSRSVKTFDTRSMSDLLKELYPQKAIYRALYG